MTATQEVLAAVTMGLTIRDQSGMWKRSVLIFASAGFLIPVILMVFEKTLRYFLPEYIGLSSYVKLALWPSVIMTMALHGDGWTVDTVVFLILIISINALLYAVVGFLVARCWFLITKKPIPHTKIFLVGGGALLLAFVVWGVGRPTRYELTDGYHGWIVIEYHNHDCPPIKVKGIYLVVEVPNSGRVCTSDPLPDNSWRFTQYEYVRADGRRERIPSYNNHSRKIWAGNIVIFQSREEGYPQQGIFVGTEDEYSKGEKIPYAGRISTNH